MTQAGRRPPRLSPGVQRHQHNSTSIGNISAGFGALVGLPREHLRSVAVHCGDCGDKPPRQAVLPMLAADGTKPLRVRASVS